MTTTVVAEGATAASVRLARWGPWLALGAYVAARLVSALFIALAAPTQGGFVDSPAYHVEGATPAAPSYTEVLTNWDGQWYETIARHGYRTDPSLFGPPAARNETAFYPAFPLLTRGLMTVTGLGFGAAASLLSVVLGGLGIVLLWCWLVQTRGPLVALLATTTLSVFPTAPIFQAAYTESLALVLLVLALRSLWAERYAWFSLAVLGLGYTRAVAAPLAVLALIHTVLVWRRTDRAARSARTFMGPAGAVVAAGLATLAWPATVAVMTGIPTAFFDTMAAWVQVGGVRGGWLVGIGQLSSPVIPVLLVVLLTAWAALRLRRTDRYVPGDRLGLWGAVYLAYVFLTTTVNTSIFRYMLLLLVPLEPLRRVVMEVGCGRRLRPWAWWAFGALVALELWLQWWWVANIFVIPGDPNLPP